MSLSQPSGHWARISSAVRSQLSSSPPDLWLVSSEGFHLPTYVSLLTLHSPLLKALLSSTINSSTNSTINCTTNSLSLPITALHLHLLLSLLSEGSVSHHVPFNPLEVLEAAELLGIDIDIHVENRPLDYSHQSLNSDNLVNQNEEIPTLESKHQSLKSANFVNEGLTGDVNPAMTEEEQDGTLQCNRCDHTASRKSNLNKHIKMVHTSDNPLYKCPSLGCLFKTKDKSHMKSHNEAKHMGVRFDCSFCQYQTPYKKSLRRHIETRHTVGGTAAFAWPCDLCQFKGLDEPELRSHTKVKHMI